jgi:hypothetical protein
LIFAAVAAGPIAIAFISFDALVLVPCTTLGLTAM